MKRRHAALVSLLLGVAFVFGGLAGIRILRSGGKSSAQPAVKAAAHAAATKRAKALDRYASALHRTLEKRPPRLPAVPHYPHVYIPAVPALPAAPSATRPAQTRQSRVPAENRATAQKNSAPPVRLHRPSTAPKTPKAAPPQNVTPTTAASTSTPATTTSQGEAPEPNSGEDDSTETTPQGVGDSPEDTGDVGGGGDD